MYDGDVCCDGVCVWLCAWLKSRKALLPAENSVKPRVCRLVSDLIKNVYATTCVLCARVATRPPGEFITAVYSMQSYSPVKSHSD